MTACGVCHTELDEIEGRTPPPRLPVVLGHQVVGRVVALGPAASRLQIGDRVGVAWIYALAAQIPIKPEIEIYPPAAANRALVELKTQRVRGAKVLRI